MSPAKSLESGPGKGRVGVPARHRIATGRSRPPGQALASTRAGRLPHHSTSMNLRVAQTSDIPRVSRDNDCS